MQKKTLRKQKFKAKALVRSESITRGAKKLLSLLAKADCEDVSSVVDSQAAVDLMLLKKGI